MVHKPTLIIHGASSYTATELLAYLDTHPQGDQFEFILAGRTEAKLESKNDGLSTRREVVAVDLSDERSVEQLVEKGDVVVNLAGPFRLFNAEALIAECARTGKHYIDLTAETDWLRTDIIPKYNYLASKTGACIIPSCGFDSVPSDMVLYNALSTLQARYPNESITRSLSMFKVRGTVSGGTLASIYSMGELSPEERDTSEWAQVPSNGSSRRPQLTYTLPSIPALSTLTSRIGAFFFMYPYNRTLVRRSWFLSRLDEAQQPSKASDANDGASGKKEPVHGPKLIYEEAMDVGGSKWFSMLVTAFMGTVLGLVIGSSLIRRVLKYFLPSGMGGTPEQLRNGKTSLLSVAHTTSPNIFIETTYIGEGDPGYWHTCHLLAECALSLVLPPPEGTHLPPLGQRGGCLTPSTALGGVLVQRLRDSGKVKMESRLIMLDEGKKRR